MEKHRGFNPLHQAAAMGMLSGEQTGCSEFSLSNAETLVLGLISMRNTHSIGARNSVTFYLNCILETMASCSLGWLQNCHVA